MGARDLLLVEMINFRELLWDETRKMLERAGERILEPLMEKYNIHNLSG